MTGESSTVDKQPDVDTGVRASADVKERQWYRAVVIGVSGAAIALCVVFISALLALSPTSLDLPLQDAQIAFAIALPLYGVALMLAITERTSPEAYTALSIGLGMTIVGIAVVLLHLDKAALIAFIVSGVVASAYGLFVVLRSRRHSVK